MNEYLFEQETYAIRGAVFEVYKELGSGFLEAVYQESLAKEFTLQKIPFVAQKELALYYKQERLLHTYKPDFICFDAVIIELKAVKNLTDEHKAQLMNYLKVTGLRLGLLVNFGHYPKVEIARLIM